MNQSPSRHPLFAAIACIALAGAWSTGAYEAESGDSLALMSMVTPDAPTPQQLGSDCPGPRGPSRALCLFEASRPSSAPAVRESTLDARSAVATTPISPAALRVAAR